MARKTRIHFAGALYHVIVRGNNKSYIFEDDKDKSEYLKKIKKYKEKYGGKLYSYVIMDNHAHLLMEVSNIPLSKIMQLIQQTYTQYYNKKYNRTGHVFEQRYKAILCNKDRYLLTLIKYIHKNPERANIADINYKWSSHHEYIGNKFDACDVDFPLSMFSNNRELAIKEYLEYVLEQDIEVVEKANYEIISKEVKKEEDVDADDDEKRSMDDIISQLREIYNIKSEDLKGKSKNRYISKAKKYFVKEVLKNNLMNQKELSEYLKITEMAVSKLANKV